MPQEAPYTSSESLIWLVMLDNKLSSFVSLKYFPAFLVLCLAHVSLNSAKKAKVKDSEEQGAPYRFPPLSHERHMICRCCNDSKTHKEKYTKSCRLKIRSWQGQNLSPCLVEIYSEVRTFGSKTTKEYHVSSTLETFGNTWQHCSGFLTCLVFYIWRCNTINKCKTQLRHKLLKKILY